MGKTPKSKHDNFRSRYHLQPKVKQHRPKNYGTEKLPFPGISEQFTATQRRMKLSGSLSRKSSKEKGLSIKVDKRSVTSIEKDPISKEMSAVTVEVSESVKYETMPVIYENGKENDQEKEGKESPSISNGPEEETNEDSKWNENDKEKEQTPEEKTIKEAETSAENASTDSLKDEELEMKKQRSGTPQSRSSTPQRKSGRIRTKQLSPSKSSATNSHPPLKILKINLTPCKSSTNGTATNEKNQKSVSEGSVKPKENDVEDLDKAEPSIAEEKEVMEVQAGDKEVNDQITADEEKTKVDADAPYLRSLRLISGRPAISRSPYSPSESNVSLSQSKKKLNRRRDAAHVKDDSEANIQVTEYEFQNSPITGKRKADRVDDQASLVAESSLKRPKNEDDDIHLYLMDDGEDKHSSEKDINISGLADDSQKSSSKHYSSEDEGIDELKYLEKDESLEFGYEAKEDNIHSPKSPTPSNQSGVRKWCVLM